MPSIQTVRRTLLQWAGALSMTLVVSGGAVSVVAAQPATPAAVVTGLPDFTEIVSRTEGSVVNIRTTETIAVRTSPFGSGGPDPYEMFRWFFGPDFAPPGAPGQGPQQRRGTPPSQQERTVPRGVGSGFFISSDGYILTNNHVVDGASDIFVTLTDGKEYPAKVVGTDARTDIALIKIEAQDLTPLPIGDSQSLKKGQWVLAIGSPFGLESTVTAGIVSAINRETGDYLPFIQTDVAVNPGNSGGPLLNLSGQVVGVNSQIVSRSGGFMGISLAIPIDEAMRVVEQLKEHGKVTRGRIGVQIGVVTEDVAKAIGLGEAKGAMVSHVDGAGPAAQAGVMPGDVITRFGKSEIKLWSDLPRVVGETRPGTKADMEVWRKGKLTKLRVTVGELPSEGDGASSHPEQADQPAATNALGVSVTDVPDAVRKDAGIKGGVQVTESSGPAAGAGIQPGDIILTVDTTDITNARHFAKVVSGLDKNRAAALLVLRDGQTQWVPVKPLDK